jgi:Helicase HerA, central domain
MYSKASTLHEQHSTSVEGREKERSREFSFGLRGVLPLPEAITRHEYTRMGPRLVHALATALPLGTRVVFGHHRTATGEIEWMLDGSENSACSSLATTLGSALAAAGGCFSFEPNQAAREQWPRSVRLRPRAVRLEIEQEARIGFQVASTLLPVEKIRVPSVGTRRGPAFSSLGALLQSARSSVSARVGVSRIELTERQVDWIRAAMRRFASSSELVDHAIAAWLEEWARVPRGWQLDCTVSSAELLPESFLHLLGGEVFGQDIEILDAEDQCTTHALDLSACCHTGKQLPRLFPVEVLLASLRQPRSYNRALPRLPENGIQIGEVECHGNTHLLRLPSEARDRHSWILGSTGVGKSSLLLRMIRQDIESGEGVALVDPHGDLFEQVLASIPPKRIGDVVLLEPGRGSRAPGLNFLEVTDGPQRELQRNFVVNELLGIFDQLWDMRECGGPMFQVYFRNAMLLLMSGGSPYVTLTELPLVFEDRAFRDRLKAACKNPMVTGFWTNQAEKAGGEASLSNIAPYITSKLNVFTHSSVLRPIIGQTRSTLDFRQILSERGIFLANLSKGLIGESEARLLGMLLLGRIFAAGMERSAIPPARRKPFSVFVDETQNFLTPTLASMLGEARKFGLRLSLGNQHLAQLSGHGRSDLLQAILGNVGSLALFRLGPGDAEKMALYTRPAFDARTLERLPNYHSVGRILTAEGPLEPLVFRTLPSPPPTNRGVAAVVRRRQRRFSRPVAQVEEEIRDRRSAFKLENACK